MITETLAHKVLRAMEIKARKLSPDQQAWVEDASGLIGCSFVDGKIVWRHITEPSGRYARTITTKEAVQRLESMATKADLARLLA